MQQEPSSAQILDRENRASLGAGLFTNGVWDMLSIVIPLYAVAVGLSPAEIGMVVSARSILPTALSIHGGILMDQLGTRRVLMWMAAGSATLPLLYPLSNWFVMLIGLQLLLGLASSLAMAAAQTWSLQASHGDTAALARYSIASRVGTFIGPVIAGAAWDMFGPWAAFSCVTISGAGIMMATAYGAPRGMQTAESGNPPPVPPLRVLSVLLPKWDQHKQAFALAAIPAMTFILAVSFMRNAPGAIQSSLYVVYLNGIGMNGTLIGFLIALSEFFGVFGSLVAAALQRRYRGEWLMIVCIAVSVSTITITPLIAHFLILLFIAAALRGIAQGVSQPLMYSIMGHAIPRTQHGASVGLRNTVVRGASIVTPTAMGMAAEAWGIEASFHAAGAVFLLATAVVTVVAYRTLTNEKQ